MYSNVGDLTESIYFGAQLSHLFQCQAMSLLPAFIPACLLLCNSTSLLGSATALLLQRSDSWRNRSQGSDSISLRMGQTSSSEMDIALSDAKAINKCTILKFFSVKYVEDQGLWFFRDLPLMFPSGQIVRK